MKLFGWLIHGVNILQLMNAYDTLQVAVKVCTLQSPSPSMQRDSCYGETWWNHWSPKFLKVSIPCIFGYVRHMSYFSWEDLTWPDDQDRSIQPDPFPIRPQKPSDFLPSTTLSMCNWRCHGGIQQNMDDQSTAAESSHIMSNHVI
jgi:hypothetical protein